MKKLTLLITLLLTTLSIYAAKLPPKEAMLSASLKEYEKLLESFFINKHCQFINKDDSKNFEHDLATIASKLRKDLGDAKMLTYKLSEARKSAEQEKYTECGDSAKSKFNYGLEKAKVWSSNIIKLK